MASSGPKLQAELLKTIDASIFEGSRPVPVSPRTVETADGGVIGLPRVLLVVSTDPKAGATFPSDENHTLKLEKDLQLMFMVSK